jgi:hypothetical protein
MPKARRKGTAAAVVLAAEMLAEARRKGNAAHAGSLRFLLERKQAARKPLVPAPQEAQSGSLEQPALEQPALEQLALEQLALEQLALEQLALEQLALEQPAA